MVAFLASQRPRNTFITFFFAASFISSASCLPDTKKTLHSRSVATRSTSNVMLPYRDTTLCIEDRVDDLLKRMIVEEKAGQLFHT
jgi:beta-glucosidase